MKVARLIRACDPCKVEAIELERGRDAVGEAGMEARVEMLVARGSDALPLGAEEIELLATSAYMLGRDDDYRGALERAHRGAWTPATRTGGALCVLGRRSPWCSAESRRGERDGSVARGGCSNARDVTASSAGIC